MDSSPSSSDNAWPETSSRLAWSGWNRRLHYLLGLYFLAFTWLFGFSGLLLNNPKWSFAEFWEKRKQTTYDRQIELPTAAGDLAQAQAVMRQLNITGEVEWTVTRQDTNRFDFRVSRPGQIWEIKTDWSRRTAAVQHIQLNGWGVVRILHTFTGVRNGDTRNQRDWLMTRIWAFSMDALAVGLVFLVASGIVVGWRRRETRLFGAVAFGAGLVLCLWFCFGLRWI